MSIRIHKLAEELGLDNKEMMALLKERKIVAQDVKSVSSTVDIAESASAATAASASARRSAAGFWVTRREFHARGPLGRAGCQRRTTYSPLTSFRTPPGAVNPPAQVTSAFGTWRAGNWSSLGMSGIPMRCSVSIFLRTAN